MDAHSRQINFGQLDSMAFGDSAFKKELIEIFLAQVPEFISNMKRLYSEGDTKNLAKEAHTAKSSVMVFGMDGTGSALKKIQLLATKGETQELSSLISEVENDMNSAAIQLRDVLKNL